MVLPRKIKKLSCRLVFYRRQKARIKGIPKINFVNAIRVERLFSLIDHSVKLAIASIGLVPLENKAFR